MTQEQRAPWVVMAEAEKKRHAALYPGYKYFLRNKKTQPTEKEVEEQIAKAAEKAAEAEAVQKATEANSKDMVTVYYPPWATRRTLTYFARRATSCPPEGAVSVEPYSEMMDRAMVTTNAKVDSKEVVQKEAGSEGEEQQSSNTAENVFVPSAYGIGEGNCSSAPWSVTADRSLSQGSYTIDPPGGTSSWGEELLLSEYPTEYTFLVCLILFDAMCLLIAQPQPGGLDLPPFLYTQQGEFMVPVRTVELGGLLISTNVFHSNLLIPLHHLATSGIRVPTRTIGRPTYLLCHRCRRTHPHTCRRLLLRNTPHLFNYL